MSMVAANASKTLEPLFVKVQNGVTHIIARVGDVLLYIETTTSGLASDTKAWVIGTLKSARERSTVVVEPALASLKHVADVSSTRIAEAASFAKCKTMGVVVPVQVKVYQGIVYVQASIAGTYVAFSAKASKVWSTAVVYGTDSYQATMSRAAAVSQRGQDMVQYARSRACQAVEPTLLKAKDGCLYIQASIGKTFVRIKVGAITQQNRLVALANSVGAQIRETVIRLTAPAIQRILALYEQARTRLVAVFGPLLQKLNGMRTKLSLKVDGAVVAMKVRTATARELAMKYPTMFYLKVKGSCVHLYELVGDKVVGIKFQMSELAAMLNDALVKVIADTLVRVEVTRESFRKQALAVSESVKNAASDKTVQATAAGSISGSATLGASGGAVGLASGTVVGAAIGVIPAVFTFGLSIPIGAAIGGSTGLVAGTVTGSVAGFVGGGVAGRTVHKHREQIGDGMSGVANKASDLKALVNKKSSECLATVLRRPGSPETLPADAPKTPLGDHSSTKVVENPTAIRGERISVAGA